MPWLLQRRYALLCSSDSLLHSLLRASLHSRLVQNGRQRMLIDHAITTALHYLVEDLAQKCIDERVRLLS